MNRRDFLELGTCASLLAALGLPARAADAPTVGLIFPPADYPIPPDAGRLYPSGVTFTQGSVGSNNACALTTAARGDQGGWKQAPRDMHARIVAGLAPRDNRRSRGK